MGKTKYCIGLQIEHYSSDILVHQLAYIEKVLKRFYMEKLHPLNSPMVVHSLEVNKDTVRPKEKNEELFGPEVPYLGGIGALIYLEDCTRLDITFFVNLLTRYNFAPTRRH